MPKKYKPVPVEVAQKIASDFDKDMVIVLAYDKAHDRTHTTTYGVSPEDKENAARLGETLTAACGADVSAKTTFEDFHDESDDHPVRISEVAAELDIHCPLDHARSGDVADFRKSLCDLRSLEFVADAMLIDVRKIRARLYDSCGSDVAHLLPAYKAKIREVFSGRSV